MGRILVLDEHTQNRIAAGEVIERPASVVKELVENSLDAGAKSVLVEISDGGISLVRVVDDGQGMEPDDVLLSLERHATSKIRSADDIIAANTLGFRGEALPSIASVSKVEIKSRVASAGGGYLVEVEGGKITRQEDIGSPVGTSVSVRDLFYNTPARRKFLKSKASETARSTEAALREALSAPHVRFRVTVDGKETFATPGGSLFDAIVSVYGADFGKGLMPVSGMSQDISIDGYVGKPGLSRASRGEQYFMVNGRPVRDAGLRWALEEAYMGSIPSGRYPVAFLSIAVNPESVDVNVHPAKTEVRFKDDRLMRSSVLSSVSRAVQNCLQDGRVGGATPWPPREIAAAGPGSSYRAPLPAQAGAAGGGLQGESRRAEPYREQYSVLPMFHERASSSLDLGSLRPVGQVMGTYIVAECNAGLALIDQHAAHERINYEKIRGLFAQGNRMVQPLLVPRTINLGPVERAVFREYSESLSRMGYDLESFGGQTLLLRSHVSVSGVEVAFESLLEQISLDRPVAREEWPGERAVAALSACVASTKAHQHLDPEGQRALCEALCLTETPLVCPHGRPTIVVLTKDELERRFGRK